MSAKLRRILPAGALLLTGFAAFWILQAGRAVDEAEREAAASGMAFRIRPVPDSSPAGMDFLAAPPDFVDGLLFEDSLYLSGAGGVWAYDRAGNLRASYLVGRDLPPSAPVAMAAGAVAGDASSRLWIGTSDGILVFDGRSFSEIRLEQEGLGNVTSLLMLPTGVLLFGLSEGGVAAYDGSGIRPFHSALRDIPVTALAGEEGDLWVGTRDRGVVHWQGGRTEAFDADDGLPASHVLSVTSAGDRTFVGTAVGVAEFRSGRHVRNVAEGVLGRSLLETDGHLLIGTLDEGVIDVRLGSGRAPSFAPVSDFGPLAVRRLLDLDGTAFALSADALFEWDARTGLWTERIAADPVWTDRNVSALALDRLGRLWMGYFDRGIDIAPVSGARRAVHIEDDQVFCINRIVPDPGLDRTVAATANGLVFLSLEGEVIGRMGAADGLISEHVTDIEVGGGGLAAATAAGVTLVEPGGPQSIYAFHGLVNNHVYALGRRGEELLAGTLGGLSLIRDGFVRASFTTSNSPLEHNWISAIAASGDAWFIGSYGGGILRLDAEGRWTDFPDVPDGTVVNPNAMLAAGGRVFAGTLQSGLLVYDSRDERWRTATAGLPSVNVTALAASADRLFVGTDNGAVSMAIEGVLN